jgi:ribonuclease Z
MRWDDRLPRHARLACGIVAALATQANGSGSTAVRTAPGDFAITLLGTGNPRPSLDRFGPCTLVEAGGVRFLVDAGRGTTERLFQIDGGPLLRGTDRVFLTHLHSDHVVGLADLWLTGWLFGRQTPLLLAGPAGTADLALHLERAFAFDVRVRSADEGLPEQAARFRARDLEPGLVLDQDGVRVTAFAVDHGPVRPAFGYRIEFGGRTVVLSGDTRATDAIVEQSRGVDVLVHEVISPEVERRRAALLDPKAIERVLARHASPEECGRIFARARPRLAVYSHIVPSPATAADLEPPTRRFYDGPLAVGHDLMTITIGDSIEITTRDGSAR